MLPLNNVNQLPLIVTFHLCSSFFPAAAPAVTAVFVLVVSAEARLDAPAAQGEKRP